MNRDIKLQLEIVHKNGYTDKISIVEYVITNEGLKIWLYFKSYLVSANIKKFDYLHAYLYRNNIKSRIF